MFVIHAPLVSAIVIALELRTLVSAVR